LLLEAQARGLSSPAAVELAAAIDDVRTHLALPRTGPPPGVARGLLAELFVLTHELRPQAMKSYGELSPPDAEYLEQEATRLTELAGKVLDDLDAQSKMEVT
jgi:hypothetical protein